MLWCLGLKIFEKHPAKNILPAFSLSEYYSNSGTHLYFLQLVHSIYGIVLWNVIVCSLMALNNFPILFEGDKERSSTLPNRSELAAGHNRYYTPPPQIFFSDFIQNIFRPMIGRPMSVNSSFDSHGSHNPNFPRDSSFDSRYQHPTHTTIHSWSEIF